MTTEQKDAIEKKKRKFLPAKFVFENWTELKPYYEDLRNREIKSPEELERWLEDRSELESYVSENLAWRYINYTRDTLNKEFEQIYLLFIDKIQPEIAPFEFALDKKFFESPYREKLDQDHYRNYIKLTEKNLRIFREENIPIIAKIHTESQKFSSITSKMTVEIEGKEITLQQANAYLKNLDRKKRKIAFEKINERRYKDNKPLDNLLTDLIGLRHKMAVNAGFENFRDYMFVSLGRFDYSVDDVLDFHNSIREEIVPLVEENNLIRKEKLNLPTLKPYDLSVDQEGKPPLTPVKNGKELIDKTIECFSRLKPQLGEFLSIMRKMGYLDLESRKGKAPGGYNYPLDEVGVPFIFMNASGNFSDLTTMVHEGGHAIHSFFTRNIKLNIFRHTPSEVAELASMSMELISMDHWDIFFDNKEDLNRARINQLEGSISMLPWIAIISKFQHWIYTHPEHSIEERNEAWKTILDEFSSREVDWNGYEKYRLKSWQRQGHIFDVPFYYIEYGIAQLGAIAVWKNYRENPQKGLENFINALKLGYTKSVPEIYETAGIKFDFSREYIHELAKFVNEEIQKIR